VTAHRGMCAGLVLLPLDHGRPYRKSRARVLIWINAMMALRSWVCQRAPGPRSGDGDVAMWFQWLLVVACGLVVLVSIASWRQHRPGNGARSW
jgi:hypothetical protein